MKRTFPPQAFSKSRPTQRTMLITVLIATVLLLGVRIKLWNIPLGIYKRFEEVHDPLGRFSSCINKYSNLNVQREVNAHISRRDTSLFGAYINDPASGWQFAGSKANCVPNDDLGKRMIIKTEPEPWIYPILSDGLGLKCVHVKNAYMAAYNDLMAAQMPDNMSAHCKARSISHSHL